MDAVRDVHAIARSYRDHTRHMSGLSGDDERIHVREGIVKHRHESYLPPIITLAVAGFVGLIVVFALDEYWDLPARSFGALLKPIRPYAFSIKVVAALLSLIHISEPTRLL